MIIFGNDSRENLIKGVNIIGDAVQTTYGPNGKNVFIKGVSDLIVTKDGATVAKYVEDEDPSIQMGIDIVRKIAKKTEDDVGDGTTTSTILAKEIVNLLKSSKDHPIEMGRKLQEDVKKVTDYLYTLKKDISSKEDLIKVATIATNNDEVLGQLIGEAFYRVGKEGVVHVEESSDFETTVIYTKGVSIESGYAAPYFINNENNECVLENVMIYISEYKLNKPKEILDIANKAIRMEKSLLIIAPKSDSSVITTLLTNSNNGTLKACLVNAPNHGHYREMLYKDIKNNIGEFCNKVIVSMHKTVLIEGTKNDECPLEIKKIHKILENKSLSDFEKSFHAKRLANYKGGIATIYSGGFSPVEMNEKKDRIEDAIGAVRAAFHEGVLPGGGTALAKASDNLTLNYLNRVLYIPSRILRESSNIELIGFKKEFWVDIDLKTKEIKDYYEIGVLDPYLVTKISLENAVSAASLILTSGCSIY